MSIRRLLLRAAVLSLPTEIPGALLWCRTGWEGTGVHASSLGSLAQFLHYPGIVFFVTIASLFGFPKTLFGLNAENAEFPVSILFMLFFYTGLWICLLVIRHPEIERSSAPLVRR